MCGFDFIGNEGGNLAKTCSHDIDHSYSQSKPYKKWKLSFLEKLSDWQTGSYKQLQEVDEVEEYSYIVQVKHVMKNMNLILEPGCCGAEVSQLV